MLAGQSNHELEPHGRVRENVFCTLAPRSPKGIALANVSRPRVVGPVREAALLLALAGCGDHGLFPSTVDPGADFSVAEVVFDQGFFYCRVEPVMFQSGCGPGNPGAGDPPNGCHSSVTSFRFQQYMNPVGDSCNGGVVPASVTIPPVAAQNYQTAQARMRRDPNQAPLLLYPTGQAQHPRVVFDEQSPEADVIRQWATQYSTR